MVVPIGVRCYTFYKVQHLTTFGVLKMSTTKPRLSITLEPHQHALLKRLSSLQARPASAVLCEYLEVVWPILERVAEALERAHAVQASELAEMSEGLASAEKSVAPAMSALFALLEQLGTRGPEGAAQPSPEEWLDEPLSEDLVGRTRSLLEEVQTAIKPPPSNTGVRISKSLINNTFEKSDGGGKKQ